MGDATMTEAGDVVILPVAGLACGGGGYRTVERVLKTVSGVESVTVNPVTEAAYVTIDRKRCSEATLRRALDRAGFLPPGGP